MDKKERKRLAYNKWYSKPENREKILAKRKEYREKNKEGLKIKKKEWDDKNQDHIYQYNHSDKEVKRKRIRLWKSRGVIDDDFDSLFEEYKQTTECWICGHDFSKSCKCLDHDHDNGEVRYICCNWCNSKLLREDYQKNKLVI